MTTAIGYTRLSQDSDASIDRQKDHIREYAAERDFDLETILNDGERSSGFDDSREQYQLLRDRVSAGSVDAIIVNDKRRLARDFDATMRLVLDLRESNVDAHTYDEGRLDLSDPMQAAIEVVQAASEHEAKLKEINRSKEAVQERIENGCYQGTPPIGLEFADDKCHLQKSDRWDDLEQAFALFENSDNTLAEISEETGFGISTLSRMRSRGRSYYEGKLTEYGMS